MGDAVEGSSHTVRNNPGPSYMPSIDPGRHGGGTYTGQEVEPTLEAYENIFGPSARDIKQDLQRFKRHGRWHLPDILKGPNQYLTDRVDGLITDATNSPFTSRILPYKYITNVDGKIKWNVWSFDEGLASRVPYESAARTLTQSKRSYAGYTVRQGMAIVLEHNFMMTDAGRENFRNQLNQLIGSIQMTNDLDVHVALVLAPSHARTMREKYISDDKTPTQICRQFVDLFGFVQKNANALDILIEEAKTELRTWGGPMPDFLLCNSKLTFQLTMTPDVTNYVTQGPEGVKRLKKGPDLQSYRGIGIVHTRAFSMETGAPPRDMLRRRVRVAEYYHIPAHQDNYSRTFQLYNEERDTWFSMGFKELLRHALTENPENLDANLPGMDNNRRLQDAIWALDDPAHRSRLPPSGRLALGAHMGADQGLGAMIHTDGSQTLGQNVSLLFRDICKDVVKPQFTWKPWFVDESIVFVPGAFDFSKEHALDPFGGGHPIPDVLRNGYVMAGSIVAIAAGANQQKLASMLVQSIAQYPRDPSRIISRYDGAWVGGAIGGVRTTLAVPLPGNASPYFSGGNDPIQNFDTRVGGAGPIAYCKRFFTTVVLRNYNRYGIPEAMCSGTVTTADTYADALVMGNTLTDDPYDQRLRRLGAFYCPNHFRNVPSLDKFYSIGDYVGRNLVVTGELISGLTQRTVPAAKPVGAGYDPMTGTLLYHIITHPDAHGAFLTVVKDALAAALTWFGTSPALQRRDAMSECVLQPIVNALAQPAHQGAYDRTSDYDVHGIYWTWPATDSTREDVFHHANMDPFAVWVKGIANRGALQITDALVGTFTGTLGAGGVVTIDCFMTKQVNLAGYAAPTNDDALSFLNMLAWRLWGDQELPLPRGVDTRGSNWGAPLTFLRPQMYTRPYFGGGLTPAPDGSHRFGEAAATGDIEVVIVRPNIEHYMLGIILGQGGEGLGSTFWGQTELSCYDDSMHGIWGMSYKYNERAIVVNERNLVRLWDVAYDSYVGGKGDTAVNWTSDESVQSLSDYTLDVTRHYRGPSMMVMAFHHGDRKLNRFKQMYDAQLKNNLPSPLVFHEDIDSDRPPDQAVDFENVHVVRTDEFRVFNKEIYRNAYKQYYKQMPDFSRLHKIRKNAGLASAENEVSSDSLAFQGSMRTYSAGGALVSDVSGSGHHGPDFTGCASLRSGKGYKINSQPTIQRMV